jgi:hypothetical protein
MYLISVLQNFRGSEELKKWKNQESFNNVDAEERRNISSHDARELLNCQSTAGCLSNHHIN